MTRWKRSARFRKSWATWPKTTTLDGVREEQWLRSLLTRAGIPCSVGYDRRTERRVMTALRGPDAQIVQMLGRVLSALGGEP